MGPPEGFANQWGSGLTLSVASGLLKHLFSKGATSRASVMPQTGDACGDPDGDVFHERRGAKKSLPNVVFFVFASTMNQYQLDDADYGP
jgi:hypothetical protein